MNGAASVSHDGAFIDVTDGIELANWAAPDRTVTLATVFSPTR